MVEVVKYSATGRRKSSVARVNLSPGQGVVTINNRPFENYFPNEIDRMTIIEPLKLTNTLGKFDIQAKITGGGTTGQAGALRLSLSRALSVYDLQTRPVLKKEKLLTRDTRMKERKKPGQKVARKKFQWVKR